MLNKTLYLLIPILLTHGLLGQEVYERDTVKRDNYLGIGETYQRVEDYKKSIEYFNKALMYDSTSIEVLFNLAVSYYRLSEYEETIKLTSKILDTTSVYAGIYDLRGSSYTSIAEWEKGYADLDKCISLGFGDGGTYYTRGFCLFNLGFYNQAISDFEKAIELNYKQCDSKEFIVNAYLIQNDHLNAEIKIKELLSSISDQNCDFPHEKIKFYKLELGTIYGALGKYEKSVSILTQSHKLGYNNSLSFLALANSYVELGKLKESKETILKAIEIHPEVKDYNAYPLLSP